MYDKSNYLDFRLGAGIQYVTINGEVNLDLYDKTYVMYGVSLTTVIPVNSMVIGFTSGVRGVGESNVLSLSLNVGYTSGKSRGWRNMFEIIKVIFNRTRTISPVPYLPI